MLDAIGTTLAAFVRDQRASVLPLVACCGVALIGASGLAIDGARLALMQTSLQRAIDAGGLSALAKLNTTEFETEVDRFVSANFAQGYVGGTITSLDSALSGDDKRLTITAQAETATTFMAVLGIRSMSASASTEVTRAVGGLELAVVLDNTGSMEDHIPALKTAATNLIDILFGDDAVGDNLYVGLVPFSQAVNIGTDHAAWLTAGSVASLDWGRTSWGGCVEARSAGLDVSDAPPADGMFAPYYWADPEDTEDLEVPNRNEWWSYRSNGTRRYDRDVGPEKGPNKGCPAPITPMTNVKATLTAAIADMNATGNTHINVGAAWGWRMLSPRWSGRWGGTMEQLGLPLAYNAPNMSKAAVIMTDGENTMSDSVYTAYGWLAEGRLGTTRSSTAVTRLNERLTATCTAMKNAGVTVYTIAFNDPGGTVEALLRGCATQADFYFDSPTAADLATAFSKIGDSLTSLRVSR